MRSPTVEETRVIRGAPAALVWPAVLAGLVACHEPPPPPSIPAPVAAASAPQPAHADIPAIVVDAAPGHAKNTFRPVRDLGAGIDRLAPGAADAFYSPDALRQVMSSGWGAATYRLNTELHVEAWHWNPRGTWSDPAGRGYFTGSDTPGEAIRHSFGYPLPLRGYTRNEGTENEGYSRLTDGDPNSYWKSNPYLARAFTGEDDATDPQWVVVDLGSPKKVDAIRIAWGAPYARAYRVQHWTGEDAIKKPAAGQWIDFPTGAVDNGAGGTSTHGLVGAGPSAGSGATAGTGGAGVTARFVRIVMTASSGTCNDRGHARDRRLPVDRRDCVGFAIRELYLGTLERGAFRDLVRHAHDQTQTTTQVSSVDPWHESRDVDPDRRDQSGLDLFYTSGVTRGLPAMVPVSVLYGTPEDSAAEIAYLEKRGYPISYVELGEEPDGQYMAPEHYAALYLQWAAAIHRVDPKLKLGGPVFTGVNEDVLFWPDARGKTSWLGRFLDYLRARGRMDDLAFMSFEHYPYEPCKIAWDALYDEPRLIGHILRVWRDDGLPERVPMLVTEVNIAWMSNGTSVDAFGGLWLADYVGAFFTAGGNATFYFHYFPYPLSQECDATWGTFGMFKAGRDLRIQQPVAQYFASQLVSQEWVQPGDGEHRVFTASSPVTDAAGHVVVTAYAVQRPDGQWSLLLVNKDPAAAHAVRVAFRDGAGADRAFLGDVAVASFGSHNYAWHPDGADGHADPDGPLERGTSPGGAGAVYVLPKASVVVLRGKIDD